MIRHAKAVCRSYSEIFFLQDFLPGLLLFVVTMLRPEVGLAGVISVVAAYGFARLMGLGQVFLESGYYTYNPLLVGLSLGYLFKWSALTAFFFVGAGILTVLLTIALAHVFATYFKLPILSLPFVLASSIAYLASLRYSNLLIASPAQPEWMSSDLGLPMWFAGFFRAIGAMVFTPSVLVGILIAGVVFWRSRILFMLAIMGYVIGTFTRSWMLGSNTVVYADVLNFNFLLIAMALGGVFLIPSPHSYLVAAVGVIVSTIVTDAITGFWSYYGIPVFTLPFNLVCLTMLYGLTIVGNPLVAAEVGKTPEETLQKYLSDRLRYPGQTRTMTLPFSGKWTVYQAFDGRWTHKGNWRYAYDFVITDKEGKTHSGKGDFLKEYHCYGKPVTSPVRGRVARIVDDLPDSPINEPDKGNNWGNLVIIQEASGFFVELSHFAADSISVKKGDWVEVGAPLGKCGNSGYSPQPHIHVQVQTTDKIGAATLPFSFLTYADEKKFFSNNLPDEKAQVEPLVIDKKLDRITNFVLDQEYHYVVSRKGKRLPDLRLTVRMAYDGTFYFDSGMATLTFGKHEGTFYFYKYSGHDPRLRAFLLSLPRLPLAYREGMVWSDYLPYDLVARGVRGAFVSLASSFVPKVARVRTRQRFVSDSCIKTEIESTTPRITKEATVELDRERGIGSISFDGWELRLKETTTAD